MKIVIASGKGGTGKTMVAANMAYAVSRQEHVSLVDCDVEEPNLHLYFPGEPRSVPVKTRIPVIDQHVCTLCGACGRFCRYGALTVLKDRVLFFSEMCHSCGGCMIACPEHAITEEDHVIGSVEIRNISDTLTLYSGIMDPGQVLAPPIIHAAKEQAASGLMVCDAAPGIACPVIEASSDADFILLVTEPTPFGVANLSQMAELTRMLGIPAAVVINRSFGDDEVVHAFCRDAGLPIWLTIPFSREFAAVQNAGDLISREFPAWEQRFLDLYTGVRDKSDAS
ncbi:MAG: ATP-binding protein [Methanocorpusculum sp.]|uniref:ATP-binding protein n=1 Tax=Methanocorpusculum sp. TaxID=2058474 RepID=UPI00271D33D0|nr:ATP-binding protein [Methanocorpusculum sp.]MDO9522361.1 ATP-binding protein [Methanocorpusculum sp.]